MKQKEQIKRLHESRKRQTKELVGLAIERLIEESRIITFGTVAEEAGVTKATIYRHPDLREKVETLRSR